MRIEKAAVLGAGTMGAQIAAHLANAGVPTLLLDIPPRELTPEEQAKGLKLESPQVRGRIARNGLEAAVKAKPAAFFTPEFATLVTAGNFDDDLAKIKDCDLIVEAVVENLEIKRSLYERVEQHRRPGSIIASNTSGIPIHLLAEGRSDDFHQHQHDVRADAEVRALIAHHEPDEILFNFRERKLQHLKCVAADRVHLGVKLETRHAIADIDQRRTCVFLDDVFLIFDRL